MDAVEMDLLARDADALVDAVEAERHRHVVGLEPEPALARLYATRARAAHRDTGKVLREEGNTELASFVAALRADRVAAEAEESWRAAEAKGRALGPDGHMGLAALERAVPGERDRGRRLLLAGAARAAMGEAASAREEATEVRARARAEVGLAPDWRIVAEADAAEDASDDGYRDVLSFAVLHTPGLAPVPQGGIVRADLLHVLALPRWDGLLKPGLLALAARLTLEKLGLDAGRLRVDDAERPTKWPGVHVHGARISFGPRGTAGDWQDLLGGVGRALAAAAQPPHRRDPSFAEALAWALSSVVLEPRWLAERADVERRHAPDLVRDLALRRLFALRADAAALRIATEVERGLSGAAWRDGYVDALTRATGATWERERASRDADAPALAARLHGAAAGERLRQELRERFDEDWWRNPRTAAHLAGLLAAGRLPEAETAPAPAEAARALVARLEGKS